jgi:hypothetical protein
VECGLLIGLKIAFMMSRKGGRVRIAEVLAEVCA